MISYIRTLLCFLFLLNTCFAQKVFVPQKNGQDFILILQADEPLEYCIYKNGLNSKPYTFTSQAHSKGVYISEKISHSADSVLLSKMSENNALRAFYLNNQELGATSLLNCECEEIPVISKTSWCIENCTPDDPYEFQTPTHIIVHHSADTQFDADTNFTSAVQFYHSLHTNTNGWDDIGYNWIIDPLGNIFEGRPSGAKGAHFSCMNNNTLGIALLGNFQINTPSQAAIEALEKLIAFEVCKKGINLKDVLYHPASSLQLNRISGHLDGNNSNEGCASGTSCPGTNLYSQLTSIQSNIESDSCIKSFNQDLYFSNASLSGNAVSISSGDQVDLNLEVNSVGFNNQTFNFSSKVAISEDSLLSPDDTVLHSSFVLFNTNNGPSSFSASVDIPALGGWQNYFLIAMLDAENEIEEFDENNNTFYIQLDPLNVSRALTSFQGVEIYPNPIKNNVFIKSSEVQISAELLGLDGSFIRPLFINKANALDDLSVGVYLIKLISDQGFIFKKIVKI